MGTLGIIPLIVAIAAVVSTSGWLLFQFIRFKQTHEAGWRDHILSAAGAFQERLAALQTEIQQANQRLRAEMEKERQKAFGRYLATISVDALQDYPGIGPATVDKLRQIGMTNLDKMPKNALAIPGIGPKRERDLRYAIATLVKDTLSRFDAGGCREAQEWKQRAQHQETAITRQIAEAEEGIRICRHSLSHLEPYAAIARRVTFIGYLRKRMAPGLMEELLNSSIDKLVPPAPPRPVPAVPPVSEFVPVAPPAGRPDKAAAAPVAALRIFQPQESKPTPKSEADLFRAALEKTPDNSPSSKQEHPRLPHLRAVARFGIAIARIDGKIARAERESIRNHLQRSFGHEQELVRWIDPAIEQSEKKPTVLDACLNEAFGLFSKTELEGLYRFACEIADATGTRTPKEVRGLNSIVAAWKIDPSPTESTTALSPAPSATPLAAVSASESNEPKPPTREDCLTALEIAPATSINVDLIRRQYRLLMEKNDPARFESHGAPFVTFVKANREKIEQAAKFLLEELGEPFEEEKKPEAPADLRHNPDLDQVFGM